MFLSVAVIMSTFPARADYFVSPDRNASVETNRPAIRLSFSGGPVNTESIRFFVNDADVSDQAVKSFAFTSYTPLEPLPDGPIKVKIIFSHAQDGEKTVQWEFTVKSPGLVNSVSHDGGEFATLGQVISVTVNGKSGCRASFDISHLIKGIELKEVTPGFYRGSYQVKEGDHLKDGKIIVRLMAPDGTVSVSEIKAPATISASFFRVRIISPKNGDYVGQTFIVEGHTTPDVLVNISSRLGFNFTREEGISNSGPTAGGYRVRSGPDGKFSQKIGFPPIVINGMKMLVYVQATDKKGDRSIPDQVLVHYGPAGTPAPAKP